MAENALMKKVSSWSGSSGGVGGSGGDQVVIWSSLSRVADMTLHQMKGGVFLPDKVTDQGNVVSFESSLHLFPITQELQSDSRESSVSLTRLGFMLSFSAFYNLLSIRHNSQYRIPT